MNKRIVLGIFFFCAQSSGELSTTVNHQNEHVSATSKISVTSAWTPALPPNSNLMAGYFSLTNKGTQTLTIVNVASPAFGSVEIHETTESRETARMYKLLDVEINAKETIRFAPGGKHLMLRDPNFLENDLSSFIVILTFSDGSIHKFSMDIKQKKSVSSWHINPHAGH